MTTRDRIALWALGDLATPWCIYVASTLRVAEHLADGERSADELADVTGTDRDALARVLRHLVGRGVFEQPEPDRFALNDIARGFLEPGMRLGFDLDGIGGRMARAWAGLPAAVRTGRAAYADIIGLPFWEDLDAHPDVADSFDEMMGPAGHGFPGPEVLASGDWSGVTRIVDVGGGTGAQLAEILKAHPEMTGTLVDLPRVVADATKLFDAAGVGERADAVAGNIFDELPPGADLYLLRSVLADWPDDAADTLLRRCAEAVRPGGRVVISGGVVPHQPSGESDLLMLVLLGGKERSLEEFEALAGGAGLEVVDSGRDPGGRFVVECRVLRSRTGA